MSRLFVLVTRFAPPRTSRFWEAYSGAWPRWPLAARIALVFEVLETLVFTGVRVLVALVVVALGLLGRFVPSYFREPKLWPSMVMIALATGTFGFSLIGLVLDRYRPAPESDRPPGAR